MNSSKYVDELRILLEQAWQFREYVIAMNIVILVENLSIAYDVKKELTDEIGKLKEKLRKQTKTKPRRRKIPPKLLTTFEWPEPDPSDGEERNRENPTEPDDLRRYLKYYFLENYLFDEVNRNFTKHGYLTAEEFFAIVIWKSNRSKTDVLNGIIKSKKTIEEITSDVFTAEERQKLKILDDIPGIGIAIASAILTVCYPNDFTIVDDRALAAIRQHFGRTIAGDPKTNPNDYFTYLAECKRLACKHQCSLRDFDRILWAIDFYEGENGLQKLCKC